MPLPRASDKAADRFALVRHLRDVASGLRALEPFWRRAGDPERAARCAEHAAHADGLIEDFRRGSPRLLRRLAARALASGDWSRAATLEERAALVDDGGEADRSRHDHDGR